MTAKKLFKSTLFKKTNMDCYVCKYFMYFIFLGYVCLCK